jgi:hypothetical protein
MTAPASTTAAKTGDRFRAAAAAKRAAFADPMAGAPAADPNAAPDAASTGASITLGLVAEDGTPIGDIGTINYDGDPSEVDSALAGVQIVFTSPDVVDLAPLQSALQGLGINEAQLNDSPPDGIPPEGGTYTVAVVGGGADASGAAPASDVAAPSFSWTRPGDFGNNDVVLADDPTAPRWEGLLVVEGIKSGDGRQIDFDALTWRNLPLPLMMMTRNPVGGEGHDGAELAGRIDAIERRDNGEVWGSGILDKGSPAGQEAMRLLTPDKDGFTLLRGVSVDLDDVEMAFEGPEGIIDIGDLGMSAPMKVAKGRIMGATLTPFPAFQEAQVTLVSDNALIAAVTGGGCDCDHEAAMVASAGDPMKGAQVRVFTPFGADALVASAGAPVIPIRPPAEWFACPSYDTIADESVRVTSDGRIYGLAADDKACHIGFADRCVRTPKSRANYGFFLNKQCETIEGNMVATGPIFMDTVHPSLKLKASDASAFYAHTGCAVADVAVYDTPKGMYIAGAVRPSATPEQIRALRGSDISPDWRVINGHLECVALLAVNTSGFITPALVASGADLSDSVKPGRLAVEVSFETGEILALVAAGMKPHTGGEVEALRTEMATLQATVDSLMQAQLAERKAVALSKLQARRQRAIDARFAEARSRFARK